MPTQTIDRNIIFKEETIVSERVKYIMLEKNEKESWIQEVLIISSQIFKIWSTHVDQIYFVEFENIFSRLNILLE